MKILGKIACSFSMVGHSLRMSNTNQIKLPYGVAQQLENLRGAIRGATAAIATGNLEAWEVREFEAVKNECTARLLEWEASIATLAA
jgi:hypothetical protein